MALLKVLVSMTLLMVITLIEYSSSQPFILENDKVVDEKETIIDESQKSEDTKIDDRLPKTVVPEHYDIFLNLDLNKLKKSNYKYNGQVNIMLEVLKETSDISLHYTNSITLTKEELYFNSTETIKIKSIESVEGTQDIKKLILEKKISTGKYTLKLDFNGIINNLNKGFYQGTYFDQKNKRRWYVATDFEPIGARNAFPCFDEPQLKATFSIKIKYNKDYTAISNTVGKTEGPKDDYKTTTFKKTPRMSTYLVAYAVTDFHKYEENNVIVYSRPDALNMTKTAAQFGNKALELLSEYTGIKYVDNLQKMQQIALPALKPTAMENWGLVTYKESALLYEENINKTIDQQRLASIISHEFAHQWFGNLVTLEWWKYVWLNEGFATYFQYLIADKINEKWRFMDQFNVKSLHSAFAYDVNKDNAPPLDKDVTSEKEISSKFDTIAYDKGAAVIRMFSHVFGEEKFKEGLKKYLDTNKYNSVTSEKLFHAFNEVIDNKTLPNKVDIATIFKSWTNQAGYPVITVTKTTKNNKTSIVVKQEPFHLKSSYDDNIWNIPLNYVQQKNPLFNDTSVQYWLTSSQMTIDKNISEQGWIIFNVQQTGYYRVNYDHELWDAIAEYLLVDDITAIHPLNRAQLIDDAFNLARAGLLNYNVTLKLVKYLERETDYIVWKAALNGLSTMNNQLGLTSLYELFLHYLKPIVNNLLNSTSLLENENDEYLTKLLRVDAIKWGCAFGSDVCHNHVKEQVRLWLDANNNVTLSPDLKKVILCAAVRNFNQSEWQKMFYKGLTEPMNSEERIDIFSSLGCSSSPEILKSYLTDFIVPDYYLQTHFPQIFKTVYLNNPIGVRVVLEFLAENVETLIVYNDQFARKLWDYLQALASRIVSEEDINLLHSIFLSIELDESEKILDIADENKDWFDHNKQDIEAYLKADNETQPITTTTTKPNSSSSLTFTSALIIISLLLAALQ